MNGLPRDLQGSIWNCLSYRDFFLVARLVCSKWRDLRVNWKVLALDHFGEWVELLLRVAWFEQVAEVRFEWFGVQGLQRRHAEGALARLLSLPRLRRLDLGDVQHACVIEQIMGFGRTRARPTQLTFLGMGLACQPGQASLATCREFLRSFHWLFPNATLGLKIALNHPVAEWLRIHPEEWMHWHFVLCISHLALISSLWNVMKPVSFLSSICQMSLLESLSLDFEFVRDDIDSLNWLSSLDRLESVTLRMASISDLGLRKMGGLPRLRYLSLENCQRLQFADPRLQFPLLQNLSLLNCPGIRDGSLLVVVSSSPLLEKFRFTGSLSPLAYLVLAKLAHLRKLTVSEPVPNVWKGRGLQELQRIMGGKLTVQYEKFLFF
jgi:hypothetical protein